MQKDASDLQLKQQQMELEKARIDAQKQIAGLQAGMKGTQDKNKLQQQMQLEGARLGYQAAKDRQDREHNREQMAKQGENDRMRQLGATAKGGQNQPKKKAK
jgi:hypothetical protein